MRFIRSFLASAVILIAALAPNPSAASTSSVTIVDYSFSPQSITIHKGDTVTWRNSGSTQHTVTADNGSFDSGNLNSGASFSNRYAAVGTFRYYCKIHGGPGGSGMSGVIDVVGASPSPTPSKSRSPSPSPTPTATHSATRSPTPTPSAAASPSKTATPSKSAAATAEPTSTPSGSTPAIALSNKASKSHSRGTLIMVPVFVLLGLVTWRILKRPRLR